MRHLTDAVRAFGGREIERASGHLVELCVLAVGGDIFKLSRIPGHSSVAVTERTYAHLRHAAHAADYGRVAFAMPSSALVVRLRSV